MNRYLFLLALAASAAIDGQWGPPAVVTHDEKPCVTYRAQLSGGQLAVSVQLEPGWHTFTMDNDKRASVKLNGKKALSSDKPTQIVGEGVEIDGQWLQPEPKDFSQPELRIFSWGYEGSALFVAPAKGSGRVRIKGQACTQTVCKNVDVVAGVGGQRQGPAAAVVGLIPVLR